MPSNHERKGVCHATCQKKTSRAGPFRPSRHGNDLGAALHSTSVEEKPGRSRLPPSGPDWHPQLRKKISMPYFDTKMVPEVAGNYRRLGHWAMASRRIVGISKAIGQVVPLITHQWVIHPQGKDGDFSAETKHTARTFRDTSEQLQNGKLMVYDSV